MAEIGQVIDSLWERSFEWRIEDFSTQNDKWYKSPVFYFANASWYLMIYPNGQKKHNSIGYINVYLSRKSSGLPIRVDYSLILKTQNEKTDRERHISHIFKETDDDWGAYKLFKRAEYLESRSELGLPDVLTLICTMKYRKSTDDAKNPPEAAIVAPLPQVVPESQNGSDSSKTVHMEALCRDISELAKESFSCDVEIKCEGETFKAHRILLGARSSVFWTMLKNNMVERETSLIEVEDIKAPIFKSFLGYLYSGTLPEINMDTAMQFYEVGDKYAVEEFQKACSEFLTDNLSESNACDVLVLAHQHSDEEFQENVISYIVDKKIPQRDEQWPNFCRKYPCLAVDVQNLYIQRYCPE